MPNVDLSAFSLEELEQLRKAIEAEKQKHQKAERERILTEARAAAARYGISVAQFLQPSDKKRRAAADAKYRNPQNPKQVWSGRGKEPAWVQEALAAGKTLADLEQDVATP